MDTTALSRLCAGVFAGRWAPYRDGLAFDAGPNSILPSDLAASAVLDDLLRRFRRTLPDADDRATLSFWSQHYFARLLIPMTLLLVGAGHDLSFDLPRMRVRFCPERGLPLCFHLAEGAASPPGADPLAALLEVQVAPVVTLLQRRGGVSGRLLWENAGWYLAWTLGQIAQGDEGARADAEHLLRDPGWPAPRGAAMAHLKAAALDGRTAARRLCCLRYGVPGVGRCAGSCPLAPFPAGGCSLTPGGPVTLRSD